MVDIVFEPMGVLKARLAGGETADVLVLAAPAIDALVAASAVVAGSRTAIASAAIGVAIRGPPGIATADAFVAALSGGARSRSAIPRIHRPSRVQASPRCHHSQPDHGELSNDTFRRPDAIRVPGHPSPPLTARATAPGCWPPSASRRSIMFGVAPACSSKTVTIYFGTVIAVDLMPGGAERIEIAIACLGVHAGLQDVR